VANRIRSLTQSLLSQPRILAAVSFVVGLLVGWWVLGWWLIPVRWTNASPTDLPASYQEDYLAMVADSYAHGSDLGLALRRLKGFNPATVDQTAEKLDKLGYPEQASVLRSLAQEIRQPPEAVATPVPTVRPTPTTVPTSPPSLISRLQFICGALLLAILLLAGGVLGARYLQGMRGRQSTGEGPQFAQPPPSTAVAGRAVQWVGLGETVRVDYLAGQPEYAQEFMIRDRQNTLLGSWTLQVPRYLSTAEQANTAVLELSLTDHRTHLVERKALFGRRGFLNEATRIAYQSSGTPEQIQSNSVIHLDAGGLHLEATVLDVAHDQQGSGLGYSRLERLSLEVVVLPTANKHPDDSIPKDESSGPAA
jgi:hypothetical protein